MIIIPIGRDENNRIVLEDPAQSVSNYHAELKIKDNGAMFLYDKSTNGSFVNGIRIGPKQDFPLQRGNMVSFANKVNLNWSAVPEVPVSEDTLRIISIGKNSDNDIQLDMHDRISRYHALLRITKDYNYFLYDMSLNGTFVNNLRIPARSWYKVKYADHVSFDGSNKLNWDLVPAGKSGKKKSMRPALIAAALLIALLAGVKLFPRLGKKDLYKEYESSVCLVVNKFVYTIDFGELGIYDAILAPDGSAMTFDPAKQTPNMLTGTGFFISEDGKLVTNRHVVSPWLSTRTQNPAGYKILGVLANNIANQVISNLQNANTRVGINPEQFAKNNQLIRAWANAKSTIGGRSLELSVVLNNTFFNNGKDMINCQLLNIADDERLDIGLLQTNTKTLPPLVKSLVKADDVVPDGELQPGKRIFILGFPMGMNLANTSQGIKANFQDGQVSRESDGFEFGHNVSSATGASGSPVFDEEGRLAGIHYSGMRGTQGFNFAITAGQLKKLLGSWLPATN